MSSAANRGQGVGDRVAALQPRAGIDEEGRQVLGDRLLEAQVEVGGHRHGDQHHRRPGRGLDPSAGGLHPVDELAPAQHQHVEHRARAERVGQRDGELAGREVLRGGDGDDAREDRPGAGRVDEAEAGADQEPGAEARAPDPRGAGHDAAAERLDPVAEAGDQQRDPEREQGHDREGAHEVVRKAEGVDHVDQRDGREGEREHEAGDHAERPSAATPDAGPQNRGQHWKDARRQRRRGARHEREQHQKNHLRL